MPDPFSDHAPGLESPATNGFAITPADGADLSATTRAIYVGGTGALAVTLSSGNDVSFAGLPAGTLLPVRIRRVKATGTTATALVGLL